jgi:hypothetical protein
LRSSRRQYSGKENSSTSDVFSLDTPPVDNRNSPFWTKLTLTPRGGETLSPAVDDLAGENSPVTLSVSCLDFDTLSVSCLDSVRFPILVGTNPFSGPREIPRFLNGVFMGQFLPQVQIPADHPSGEIIRWAAATLRTLPAYQTRSDYIEHRIWTLVTMDVPKVTHHAEAVAKCPTIRLGVSDECFTYCNAGANMNECPLF